YPGRAGLTAERFVPDPFSGLRGERLYRTGDRMRRRVDGELEFLGRMDGQVKIRGFRIETGEVEAVLGACPRVRECVVVAREDTPGDRRLVAYVVPSDPAPSAGELRSWLQEQLPEHMVPAAFVAVEHFPLGPNGKVQRHMLPSPDGGALPDGAFVAPESAAEERVARIWAELLNAERVGIHESFFDLGGNSLLLIQLHRRLREAFRGELSVVDLFRYTTVQAQAHRLGGRGTDVERRTGGEAPARLP
ncbi:MAG TPA: phosphopantetheine-binding protein, partial [Longimicrobiaceae bacterium]|nr:phosphopantetheine-binding protein [Longimicrobiaceae bacterium]